MIINGNKKNCLAPNPGRFALKVIKKLKETGERVKLIGWNKLSYKMFHMICKICFRSIFGVL